MSGEKTLSLFARNVRSIRVEVEPPAAASAAAPGHADQRQLRACRCSSTGPSKRRTSPSASTKCCELPPAHPGKRNTNPSTSVSIWMREGGDRRGMFLVRVQAWDCDMKAAARDCTRNWNNALGLSCRMSRLLVVTDLGLVVKRSVDGSQDVFVQSIATGAPDRGRGRGDHRTQRPARAHARRASDGHVRFPDFKSFQRERAPVLYLARRGGDSSFLPFDGAAARWICRASKSAAWKATPIAPRCRLICSPIAASIGPAKRSAPAAIVRSQDWSARPRPACRCDWKSPTRGHVDPTRDLQAGRGRLRRNPATDEGNIADRHLHAVAVDRARSVRRRPDRLDDRAGARLPAGPLAHEGRLLGRSRSTAGCRRRSSKATSNWRTCSARLRRIAASWRS